MESAKANRWNTDEERGLGEDRTGLLSSKVVKGDMWIYHS